MRSRLTCRFCLAAVMLIAAGLLIAACGGGKPVHAAPPSSSGSWPYPNADLANTRDAPDSTISSANVSQLRQAWTFKLTGDAGAGVSGFGALAAGPIVENGVVYIQDLDGNVYALALATGKLKWEYRQMPLGAATVSNDLVLTTLYDGVLIALNRNTGAFVYRRELPTSANAPIAIAGNTVLVPAGAPSVLGATGGTPQVVAYTAP